ncbi:MAG: hypothetical protein ACRBHB_00225 [Arenicella sp.]
MLKIGCIILGLWSLLNLIASLVVVLIPVILLGENAPAVLESISERDINRVDSNIVNNANAIAVFANGVNVAFGMLSLSAIWCGLFQKIKWVFWALFSSLTAMWLTGIAADFVVGIRHPEVNIASGLILATGLICSAIAIFRQDKVCN